MEFFVLLITPSLFSRQKTCHASTEAARKPRLPHNSFHLFPRFRCWTPAPLFSDIGRLPRLVGGWTFNACLAGAWRRRVRCWTFTEFDIQRSSISGLRLPAS